MDLEILYPDGAAGLTDRKMYELAIAHIGSFNLGMQRHLVQPMIDLIDAFHLGANISQTAREAIENLLNELKIKKPALVIQALTTDWTLMFSPTFYTLTMNLADSVRVTKGFVWPQEPGHDLGGMKHHLQYTWDLIVKYREENLMSVFRREVLWWLQRTDNINKSESGMFRAAVFCFPAFDHGFQRTLLSHLLFQVYRAMTNKSFESPETKEAALKVGAF